MERMGLATTGNSDQVLEFIQKTMKFQELLLDKLSNVLKESIGETKESQHVLTLTQQPLHQYQHQVCLNSDSLMEH